MGSSALVACGPAISVPGDTQSAGTGGGETDGSDTHSTSETGPVTTTGPSSTSSSSDPRPPNPTTTGPVPTTGTTSNGSTGRPLQCEAFASDPVSDPGYALTIRNVSDAPLYVQPLGCSWRAPFVLRDGDRDWFRYAPDTCAPHACDDVMQGEQCGPVGCPDCAAPPPVMLFPGGTWTDQWSGLRYDSVELPASCAAESECAGPCTVGRELATSGYTAELEVYRDCEGECLCEGDLDAPECYLLSGTVVDPVTVEVDFAYPGDLDIVIDYAGNSGP